MKQFIKKTCIWALPVLLIGILAEWLLRKIPNDYTLKVRFYESHASDIETLILGNSHAYYDLNPVFFKSKTYNGANVAQTLDIDAKIFFKYKNTLAKLKYLIIPISDMSFFFKLKNSNDSWRLKNYAIYYNINVSNDITDYSEILSLPFSINRHRLISYYADHETAITSSDLGWGNNYNSKVKHDLNETVLKTVRVHRIDDAKNLPEEKRSLQRIVSFCYTKNIKVILFIPPGYSGYSSKIDSKQLKITLSTCKYFATVFSNVYFFNLLNDSSYKAEDYYDADHLNEIGAKKLSLKLDSIINHLPI
jgi:hypothetical protein